MKRDSSIFRIRSQTAPIGLMRTIDTERVRVEIQPEDLIIMLSDGISQTTEDSTWLLELISRVGHTTPADLCARILDAAREHTDCTDDMSVIVLRVRKI